MSRSIRRSMAVLIGIILVLSVFCVTRADAASKGVKSIKNVNSGIRVTWYEEKGQSGYHVYRKAETSTRWNLVATVKGSDNLKWTDTSTINGKRYRYKVVSYKGKKEKSNSAYKTIYRVKTPRITKLYNIGNKSFQIRTNKNSKATGYQVKYSLSSNFSSASSVTKKTKQLNTKVKKLKAGKKYYVKVRAYKKVNGKKYYSAWSESKTVKVTSSYTAYTTNVWTFIYPKMKSDEGSAVKLWYHTPIKVLEDSAVYSKGKWTKVKYLGKTYYMWTDKGETKLTKKKPLTSYTKYASNDFQKAVLEKALYILNNWDTKYDYTHKTEDGVAESDGRYAFDCSGFCSYVINSVMQETCPAFELSPATTKRSDTVGMYDQDVIVNEGLKGEIGLKTIYDVGDKFSISKLKVGDLIFFDNNDDVQGDIDHVGMYIGNGEFIQSTKTYMKDPDDLIKGEPAGGVCIAPLDDEYEEDFMAVRRIDPQEVVSADIKMITIKGKHVTVYSNSRCDSTKDGDKLVTFREQTPMTLLFTLKKGKHVNAYVKYDGGEGFIYEYKDRLTKVK